MERLQPRNYLEISTMTDAENVSRLPVVVVIEKGKNISVYKVEGKDVSEYFDSVGKGNPFPFFGNVEEATRKFGKPISEDAFLKASVFPAQFRFSPKGSYAMYRAKFEE